MNKFKVTYNSGYKPNPLSNYTNHRNLNYKCPVCNKQIRPTEGAYYVNSYVVCSEKCTNMWIFQHMDDVTPQSTWEHVVISRMAKEIQVGIDDLIVKDLLTKASK